ncbi:DUF4236 domain-containing protein [Geopseudomonas aromaticivorans]
MGFRFSKRITILPGVRLNISKSGVSTSVGPRGLSLTAGRSGVHLNAGIPGTGLSYRERLDRPSGAPRPGTGGADSYNGTVSIAVEDDGSLTFTDQTGNPLPAAVAKRIQAERADDIERLLLRAADKMNADLEACLGIHLKTPPPHVTPAGLPDFCEPEPVPPRHEEPSLMDKILFRAGEIAQRQAAADALYQQDHLEWSADKEAHVREQAAVAKALRLAAQGFGASMDSALEFVLSGIAWPKETLVDYAISYDQTTVALDVDLPDEGDTPRTTAEVRPNKLALKKRTDAQTRRDFVALCYSSLFRVTGEVFAALPTIQRCVVSGYIQRPDPATGAIRDDYIISAVIDREAWSRIDFTRLANLEPAEALKALGARVKLDRSSRFAAIEPFEMTDHANA